MTFHALARAGELLEGDVRHLRVAGIELLLVNHGGDLRLFEARCPHAGRSLQRARIANGVIRCPGHGIEFSLGSGAPLRAGICPALGQYAITWRDNLIGVELP